MHYLYIVYSKSIDRYYVGETPDIESRLQQHKKHYFKRNFTKAADDWEIALLRKCSSKKDSFYLESFIKRMKSRKFIQKIIARPEIFDAIFSTEELCFYIQKL